MAFTPIPPRKRSPSWGLNDCSDLPHRAGHGNFHDNTLYATMMAAAAGKPFSLQRPQSSRAYHNRSISNLRRESSAFSAIFHASGRGEWISPFVRFRMAARLDSTEPPSSGSVTSTLPDGEVWAVQKRFTIGKCESDGLQWKLTIGKGTQRIANWKLQMAN